MPGIITEEFLGKISNNQFTSVRLMGMHDGKFYLMLETEDDVVIHEGRDGRRKELRWFNKSGMKTLNG